ncbi:TraB/GumN family protein [Luteimonas sp. FCS-9]|uniref:TraB/GumN family protein n=1 Tax=Luteimonas sp. FCS-9 TaxID=1547516 RepID=UPI00063EC522|nr:TraB/GumN family protein [Luteimonas sp. FCS-9]KLJ01105.1 hypothetical protein WQ56_07770 [Luteimonas sp. FCS-9]
MRGTIVGACLALLLGCTAMPVRAQVSESGTTAPAPAGPDIVDLRAVVVSGAQPGPGLWQVHHGDHTLYVLGELSPLPRDMDWMSGEVEAVVARSQAVIAAPGIRVESGVGRLRGMLLLPSLLRARRNPDGARLQDVVPPALYARWQPLKARWLGRGDRVERWRPILAAAELYESAIKRSRLRQGSVVQPVVARVAKAHDIPVIEAEVEIRIDDPKALLREFGGAPLDDIPCFERMLVRIERDLQHMGQRANAWAVGDIATLRALPGENAYAVCMRTFTQGELAKRLGVEDIDRRVEARWLEAGEAALAQHPTTFATLPMALVLGEHGYLAKLAAKGYVVEAP